MATIIENLKKILEARYGKDVRQAIHDSIENCYNDGKAGSIDLQARHDIEEIGTKIETVESIAKWKNQARVFSTTEAMENWLSDSANKGVANVGDNLYIVAVDVPDWWISSVLEAPNESGMYYEIAQLETQKVDLTTIESAINSIDSKIGSTDISAIGDGTVTGGLDALNSNLNEFKDTLGSSESIKIDTSYYTDSISIQFNSSYKIYGLKMAFIYTKLINSSPYPSNAVWGRVSCPPKSLIVIPAFVKTTTDQWIPFYVTIDTNGEIRQDLTGEAKEIWICGSYIY